MKNPFRILSRIVLAATLAGATAATAQSHFSAMRPDTGKVERIEALRLAPDLAKPAAIALGAADTQAIDAVRRANAAPSNKRLQVGIGRPVSAQTAATSAGLKWQPVAGGTAAHWNISSSGARALRIGLDVASLPAGVEIRFAGAAGQGPVYGPFTIDVANTRETWWSPVLEGESAVAEVFLPMGSAKPALVVSQVSHLFASPTDANIDSLAKIGESQSCEVDLICRSASDAALATTGRAVARMTFSVSGGGTALCTGTLLNPTDNSFTPYFYSAAHCFSTQSEASSLTTHWFYDRTGCGSGGVGSSYVQLTGGATLLYANTTTDVLFLRLNQTPPQAAVYAGWDAATLATGTSLTAVHHPAGDVKKVSLGRLAGFTAYGGGSGSNHLDVTWNSTATGVTEGGSSGSGIFSFSGSSYQLRGGLHGGPSSCSESGANLRDYYSRFDQAYSSLSQYLNPTTSCSYSLSATSASVGAAATSGSFTVTASSGCSWTATSNASWITITGGSSGSGSGTVTYSVAANTSSARSGTITAAGQTFTVSQSAGSGGGTETSIIANGGFESGSSGWSQQTGGPSPVITSDATRARTGSGLAWFGGYNTGMDIVTQDIAIPSGAANVTLRFWYRISTAETVSQAFDVLAVRIQNTSGSTLATLTALSNMNATSSWVQTQAFDLSAYAGQTIRLSFTALLDDSLPTSFYVDDITLTATTGGGSSSTNYTGLYYNAPADSEAGWGVNFTHQGDKMFATLFTYDASGQPMWLVMSSGTLLSGSTYSGVLYRTTGPAFDANPFVWNPATSISTVGTLTVSFTGSDTAQLTYSYNGTSVTKSIVKQRYGTRVASCTSTTGSRAGLTNYQDLWYRSPAESEAGWGINLTHQDNIIFATLFTYDRSGRDLWLVMSRGERQSDGSYTGVLYRTTGPAFNANPFNPLAVAASAVGTMSLRFTDGANGTLTYTYLGSTVVKPITRQVFWSPLPACS